MADERLSGTDDAAYVRSAAIYDLFYTGTGIKDYRAEAEEVDRRVRTRNPSATTLLDVACGTGQHLSFLAGRYAVEGADVTPEMLAQARERLPRVPLHLADMRGLDLGRTFDAITCMFSSIGHLLEPAEMRAAFVRFAQHLAPGGVLIVDGWVRPEAWMDGHLSDIEQAEAGGVQVFRLTHSRRADRITTLTQHYLMRDTDGIDHFVERHVLALTPTDEYVRAAEAAGLRAEVIPDYMPGRDRIVGIKPPSGSFTSEVR
jgi:SAM-dependent methyltransferase